MDSLGGVRSLTELQGSVYGSAVNGGSRMGSSNGMGSLNGVGSSSGMGSSNGMNSSNTMGSSNGMNSSNTTGSSNGMNSSNTMTSPNTMTPMNAATPMNPMDDASNADYAPQDAYPMEEDFASPLTDVLQQMIASPETFNVDTIDDVSFPGRRRDWLRGRLQLRRRAHGVVYSLPAGERASAAANYRLVT